MSVAKRSSGENRKRRRANRGGGAPADWGSISPELLQQAISAVTRASGAIRFGYTRDGGSYAVGILGDGDPYTEYLRPTDNVEQYFEQLIEDWSDGPPT